MQSLIRSCPDGFQAARHRILAEISLWPEEFQAAVRQEHLTHQRQTQASLASIQQRLRVVEIRLTGADRVTPEGFQELSSRVEQLDQTSTTTNIMAFGLPEHHGPRSSGLADAVGQQLHGVNPAFSAPAVIFAQRLGKRPMRKPRPIRVTLVSAGAKRAAFQAKGQLRQERLRMDDDLAKAQQKRRSPH